MGRWLFRFGMYCKVNTFAEKPFFKQYLCQEFPSEVHKISESIKISVFSTCMPSSYNKVSHVADMIGLIFCSILGVFTYLKFFNSDLCARNI